MVLILEWLTMRGAVALRPIELAKMQNVNLKDDMWQDLFNIVRDLDANAIRNLVVGIGSLLSGIVASVMGEHSFSLIGFSLSLSRII